MTGSQHPKLFLLRLTGARDAPPPPPALKWVSPSDRARLSPPTDRRSARAYAPEPALTGRGPLVRRGRASGPGAAFHPTPMGPTNGYGSIKPLRDRRFWSMCPFTRVPLWVAIFDPQPDSNLVQLQHALTKPLAAHGKIACFLRPQLPAPKSNLFQRNNQHQRFCF